MAIYLEVVEGNPPTKLKRQITMTIKTYTPAEALQAAQAEGQIEIAPGVYLNSQESIVADQANLGDEDGAKTADFTTAPFLITTDDGQVQPVHGEDDKDLIEVLANA